MAQEINQPGVIEKLVERNVVFNRRTLESITIINDVKVNVYMILYSNEGEVGKNIEIPYDDFIELESNLWNLIDRKIKGSD